MSNWRDHFHMHPSPDGVGSVPCNDEHADEPELRYFPHDKAMAEHRRDVRARALRVLAEHQTSKTPGQCTCGFWNVLPQADHQLAMLDQAAVLA